MEGLNILVLLIAVHCVCWSQAAVLSKSAGGSRSISKPDEKVVNARDVITELRSRQSRGHESTTVASLDTSTADFGCFSFFCYNGGVCVYDCLGSHYCCRCPPGYNGSHCENKIPVRYCNSKPCLNGGTCKENGKTYVCECPEQYTGRKCEEQVKDDSKIHVDIQRIQLVNIERIRIGGNLKDLPKNYTSISGKIWDVVAQLKKNMLK